MGVKISKCSTCYFLNQCNYVCVLASLLYDNHTSVKATFSETIQELMSIAWEIYLSAISPDHFSTQFY